jgi:hypothetical protein
MPVLMLQLRKARQSLVLQVEIQLATIAAVAAIDRLRADHLWASASPLEGATG